MGRIVYLPELRRRVSVALSHVRWLDILSRAAHATKGWNIIFLTIHV